MGAVCPSLRRLVMSSRGHSTEQWFSARGSLVPQEVFGMSVLSGGLIQESSG